MDVTTVKLELQTSATLSEIASKYKFTDEDYKLLAGIIDHDEKRINEFVKTFMHRKTIKPATKWMSLHLMNRLEDVWNLLHIDISGGVYADDEKFMNFVINRYIDFIGLPVTFSFVGRNVKSDLGYYPTATHIMNKYAPTPLKNFLDSEFAYMLGTPEDRLKIKEIIESF